MSENSSLGRAQEASPPRPDAARVPCVTYVVPIGWTIGEACAGLCGAATRLGVEERARFNWIVLVARPGDAADALARAYWRAVVERRERAVGVPVLGSFNPVMAMMANRAAEAAREDIAEGRV